LGASPEIGAITHSPVRLHAAGVDPLVEVRRSIGPLGLAEKFVFLCPRWKKRRDFARVLSE
jgi:hypothetical protein